MAKQSDASDLELKTLILTVLDENRIMSLGTIRADGWPQVTIVGYIHDDLDLYFAVARGSQKLENIRREPRVSVAIGQDSPGHIRGLSMAALASEVTDLAEVGRLNALILQRYPSQTVFAPRGASCAVMRASPEIVSIIDHPKGPGLPVLVGVTREAMVRRLG